MGYGSTIQTRWMRPSVQITPSPVALAAYDILTKLSTSGNDNASSSEHVASAFPLLFGWSVDASTGRTEFGLIDPRLKMRDNTAQIPHPDGGDRVHWESESKT